MKTTAPTYGMRPSQSEGPADAGPCEFRLPARLGTTATAATATVIAAAAAEAAAARRLGLRFVDGQIAAAERIVVVGVDRLLRFLVRAHFDERETAGAARRLVAHDVDAVNGADAAEELLKILFVRGEGKVTDEKLTSHGQYSLLLRLKRSH